MGQYITYSRVADYWAADLPVNRGRWNFDTLRYDYYLDDNVAFEAFKAGAVDRREETVAKNWATRYVGRNFSRGYIIKDEHTNTSAQDTQWLAFNIQRPIFADRRVRQAITLAFDFEWMNKALFYSAYQRANSYFQNTEYAARSLPDAAELALLTPMKNELPRSSSASLPAAGLPRRWLRSRQLTQSRRPAQCGGLDGEEPAPGQRRHRQAAAL